MHLLFYVSGHGFGHSTRCIPTIEALPAEVQVSVGTTAPRRLYEADLARPFAFDEVELDVGAVQRDALTVDPRATLERFAALWGCRQALVDDECRRLESRAVDAVVCDIPAMAPLIAERLRVPCFSMTNFSWDWIYRPYVERHPEYAYLVDEQAAAYGKVDTLFRLPFAGDLSAFPRRLDTPLVCRPLREARDTVRQRYNLRAERPAVLVSFGGFALGGWGAAQLAALGDLDFVVPGRWRLAEAMPPNVRVLEDGTFYHPDLVAAVDVVVGKLGYGLVSECVLARTPLLVVRRSHFVEQDAFLAMLPDVIPVAVLEPERFFAGDWREAIFELLERRAEPPRRTLATDGAAWVAQRLVRFVEGP